MAVKPLYEPISSSQPLQFSLRWLLVAMTVMAIATGIARIQDGLLAGGVGAVRCGVWEDVATALPARTPPHPLDAILVMGGVIATLLWSLPQWRRTRPASPCGVAGHRG